MKRKYVILCVDIMRNLTILVFSIFLFVILPVACSSARPSFSPETLPKGLNFFPINEIPIIYTDSGSGEPIILLTPYPFNTHIWDRVAQRLRRFARVIVIETPGLRYPRSMKGNFSTEHLLNIYREFVRGLQLGKVHIVGVGEAGALAVAFGHHYPGHIASVISINGYESITWSRRIEKMMAHFSGIADEKALLDEGLKNLFSNLAIRYEQQLPSPETLRKLLVPLDEKEYIKGVHARHLAYSKDIKSAYIASMIPSVQYPLLVIRSEEDQLLDVRYIERTRRKISRVTVRLETLPEAGHFAFIDQPVKVSELIQEFVSLYPIQ